MIKIKKGLDIPISGTPSQTFAKESLNKIQQYAVLASDYPNLRPAMKVVVGDKVKKGGCLFYDKSSPEVCYVAPSAGTVVAINRGAKRALISVVIEADQSLGVEKIPTSSSIKQLSREDIVKVLAKSGEWTSFRTRPFNVVPPIDYKADALFINVMDSNPLAPSPAVVTNSFKSEFLRGVQIVSKLTDGFTYINTSPVMNLEADINRSTLNKIIINRFNGPHPSGLTGTHIAKISPMKQNDRFLTINYQDVIAIGHLFECEEITTVRVISLAGPQVTAPQLYKVNWGAQCSAIVKGLVKDEQSRVISGSILNGHSAEGATDFLGRSHTQIAVLPVSKHRDFLHYLAPGFKRYSSIPIYLSHLQSKDNWNFTTNTNGSNRAMVPIGLYENIMPLDILPTPLLRALLTTDTVKAQQLGCLELAEEDLALCTYVCSGKHDFGAMLRIVLNKIAQGE